MKLAREPCLNLSKPAHERSRGSAPHCRFHLSSTPHSGFRRQQVSNYLPEPFPIGLIVKTPDGTKQYGIRVDNSGNLVSEQIRRLSSAAIPHSQWTGLKRSQSSRKYCLISISCPPDHKQGRRLTVLHLLIHEATQSIYTEAEAFDERKVLHQTVLTKPINLDRALERTMEDPRVLSLRRLLCAGSTNYMIPARFLQF